MECQGSDSGGSVTFHYVRRKVLAQPVALINNCERANRDHRGRGAKLVDQSL